MPCMIEAERSPSCRQAVSCDFAFARIASSALQKSSTVSASSTFGASFRTSSRVTLPARFPAFRGHLSVARLCVWLDTRRCCRERNAVVHLYKFENTLGGMKTSLGWSGGSFPGMLPNTAEPAVDSIIPARPLAILKWMTVPPESN